MDVVLIETDKLVSALEEDEQKAAPNKARG